MLQSHVIHLTQQALWYVLLLILLVGAFIGFAGYVTVCDRIVGPDDTHDFTTTPAESLSSSSPAAGEGS